MNTLDTLTTTESNLLISLQDIRSKIVKEKNKLAKLETKKPTMITGKPKKVKRLSEKTGKPRMVLIYPTDAGWLSVAELAYILGWTQQRVHNKIAKYLPRDTRVFQVGQAGSLKGHTRNKPGLAKIRQEENQKIIQAWRAEHEGISSQQG
jgi:hypothetical protein